MTGPFDIRDAAEEAPEALALVHGTRRFTYAELAAEAAPWIRAAEGRPVDVLVGASSMEAVLRTLGGLAAATPLAFLHPRSTEAEQKGLQDGLRRTAAAPRVHDGAAVFFTSGTSGQAKGAVLTTEALAAAAEASEANLGWRDDDRWSVSIPLGHVGGFSVLTRCVAARRAMVLPDTEGPWRPEDFLRLVRAAEVSIASLVPTQLSRLLEADLGPPPDSLRVVLVGGAAAAPELVVRARKAGYPVLTTYGLTEACAQVATEAPGALAPAGSVGRPLLPGSVRIVQGRIQVRSPALMLGYLGQGRAGFTEDGWLETLDLGRLDDDGYLYVLGRASELVVSGGENVYPAEVEAALAAVSGVREVLVFGRPHPEWGEQVCAAIVPAPDELPSREALEARAAALAPFKRPRAWALVDALPRTARGKPDRRGAADALSDRLGPVLPGG